MFQKTCNMNLFKGEYAYFSHFKYVMSIKDKN